jgi:S1-C subfamily serine protease
MIPLRANHRVIALFALILCAPLTVAAQSAHIPPPPPGFVPFPPMPAERELRKDIPTIAKDANGAIVSIIMGNKDGPIAQGTGFFIDKNGAILTNYHVIRNGDRAIAEFPDGRTVTIDGVFAFDKTRDVAIRYSNYLRPLQCGS